MAEATGFTARPRKPRPGTLAAIVLLHVVVLYGLARAFAPGFTASVQRDVVSAFTVTVETRETPPEPEAEPDPGASGEEGRKDVPKPVVAPEPKMPIERQLSAPKASSTGTANSSGAKPATPSPASRRSIFLRSYYGIQRPGCRRKRWR